jgi:hypothetical protein
MARSLGKRRRLAFAVSGRRLEAIDSTLHLYGVGSVRFTPQQPVSRVHGRSLTLVPTFFFWIPSVSGIECNAKADQRFGFGKHYHVMSWILLL